MCVIFVDVSAFLLIRVLLLKFFVTGVVSALVFSWFVLFFDCVFVLLCLKKYGSLSFCSGSHILFNIPHFCAVFF